MKMKTYPLCDRILGWPINKSQQQLRAVATGERRPPKKGEWYLSGAVVEAYHVPNDLATPFSIARIVQVETIQITRIVGLLELDGRQIIPGPRSVPL